MASADGGKRERVGAQLDRNHFEPLKQAEQPAGRAGQMHGTAAVLQHDRD